MNILNNFSIDLNGSGSTAEWTTAAITFLAILAAGWFAWRQIAIMTRPQTIIENQEKKNKRAGLVANFRKIPLQHPTEPGIQAYPMSGLSYDPTLEMEIRNIGPANARKIKATIMAKDNKDNIISSSMPMHEEIIAGDKWLYKFMRTERWQELHVILNWEDDSNEERSFQNVFDLGNL